MQVQASNLLPLAGEGTPRPTSIVFMKDLQTHPPHEDDLDLDGQQFH